MTNLLESLKNIRDNKDTSIDVMYETKSIYDYDEDSRGHITIRNNATNKDIFLQSQSDTKSFLKSLKLFNKKFGKNAKFDDFVTTFGYDELMENSDYKYNMKEDKEKTDMSDKDKSKEVKTDEEDIKKKDVSPKDKKEMDDEKDSKLKEDKLTDDDKVEEESDDESNSDDDDEKELKSEKKDKTKNESKEEESDDDDDDDKMEEAVHLEDILDAKVESIKIDVDELIDTIGEDVSDEDKKVYAKMAGLLEDKLKAFTIDTGTSLIEELEIQNEQLQIQMIDKLDEYTNFTIKNWLAENHVEIVTNTRNELNENVLLQIVDVLKENNVNITDEELSKANKLKSKIEDRDNTVSKLSEEVLQYASKVEDLEKQLIRKEFVFESEEAEITFDELVEDVEYINEENYRHKLDLLKTKYISESAEVVDDEDTITEDVKSLLEGMETFTDVDVDISEFESIDEDKEEKIGVSHPSDRVKTLFESLKSKQ